MGDYLLCGWRVQSELPLPETPIWPGPEQAPVDVRIRLGTVPEHLPDPVFKRTLLQISADRTCLLTVPGVASFLITGGHDVIVAPVIAADSPDIRAFLFASPMAILCYQRNLIPFHGSALRIKGGQGALVIAGLSSSGKSTLAAGLMRRGLTLMADDICPVEMAPSNEPQIWPVAPEIKLWRDSMEQLGISTKGLAPCRPTLQKYFVPEERFDPAPQPVRAILFLRPKAGCSHPAIATMDRAAALPHIRYAQYQTPLAAVLGCRERAFATAALLCQNTKMAWLDRPLDGLSRLDEMLDCVLDSGWGAQ